MVVLSIERDDVVDTGEVTMHKEEVVEVLGITQTDMMDRWDKVRLTIRRVLGEEVRIGIPVGEQEVVPDVIRLRMERLRMVLESGVLPSAIPIPMEAPEETPRGSLRQQSAITLNPVAEEVCSEVVEVPAGMHGQQVRQERSSSSSIHRDGH